ALDDVVHSFGAGGMQTVDGRCKPRDPFVAGDAQKQCVHQDKLNDEPEESRELEPKWLESMAEGVIDGERGRDQWPIGAAIRIGVECTDVGKEMRDPGE